MSDSGAGSSGQASPWQGMADEIYDAVTSGHAEDKARAITALRTTGTSEEDAEAVYTAMASIAESEGNREGFLAVLRGESEAPAEVSDDEVQAFGMARGGMAAGPGGAAAGGIGQAVPVSDNPPGKTWQGTAK